MTKWSSLWLTALFAGLVVLSAFLVLPDVANHWVVLAISFALVISGYALNRPTLHLGFGRPATTVELIGALMLVAGIALGSFTDSAMTILLSVACPVVWITMREFRPGAIASIGTIAVVAVATGAGSHSHGTLANDWVILTVGSLVIMVFSHMIGTMVHAARKWGQERAELLEDLQTTQTELGESYRQLMAAESAPGVANQSPLSSRETEVLVLVSQGCTNREISSRLFISPATVKTHMEHILTKLGATTRTQAVMIAHQSGLLA